MSQLDELFDEIFGPIGACFQNITNLSLRVNFFFDNVKIASVMENLLYDSKVKALVSVVDGCGDKNEGSEHESYLKKQLLELQQ